MRLGEEVSWMKRLSCFLVFMGCFISQPNMASEAVISMKWTSVPYRMDAYRDYQFYVRGGNYLYIQSERSPDVKKEDRVPQWSSEKVCQADVVRLAGELATMAKDRTEVRAKQEAVTSRYTGSGFAWRLFIKVDDIDIEYLGNDEPYDLFTELQDLVHSIGSDSKTCKG